MEEDSFVITCENCYREWDGNAQCPCGLELSDSDSDDDSNNLKLEPIDYLDDFEMKIYHFLKKRYKLELKILFSQWKNFVNIEKLSLKRYDLLDDNWYSKEEMNDYYGDDYIWNQQSPEIMYIKKDLVDLIYSTLDLPIERVKLLIDKSFEHVY